MTKRECGAAALLLASLCAGLAACSRDEAATAARPAAHIPAKGISYEVVTVQRPESVEEYHKLYRGTYETCASIRKSQSMPPPAPMKQPPPDFVIQRETYISDGTAYYSKREDFAYVVDSSGDRPSCDTREDKAVLTEVLRDGMMYHTSVDAEGKAMTEPPEEAPPPRRPSDAVYSEPKVVKGQAVKCMKLPPNTGKLLTEQCAADLKPGTLYYDGRPIVLAGRVTIVNQVASNILTEPVRVKVGHQVDKRVFDTGKP